MAVYYSPAFRGFFHDEIHGPRTLAILDPDWVASEVDDGADTPEHPLIVIDNPDCKLPSDAIEITEQEHADLMAAQSLGHQIVPDADGQPVALAPSEPTPEEKAAKARADRDTRLKATDWTQAADVPPATADKWRPYRQALRDVPQQVGFPESIQWPDLPA